MDTSIRPDPSLIDRAETGRPRHHPRCNAPEGTWPPCQAQHDAIERVGRSGPRNRANSRLSNYVLGGGAVPEMVDQALTAVLVLVGMLVLFGLIGWGFAIYLFVTRGVV